MKTQHGEQSIFLRGPAKTVMRHSNLCQPVPRSVGGEIHLKLIQPLIDKIKWFVCRDNVIFATRCDKHVVVEFTSKRLKLSFECSKGNEFLDVGLVIYTLISVEKPHKGQ